MELLRITRPYFPRTVEAPRSQHMEMERSRPSEKRACSTVPDRDGKRVKLLDGRHNVSVEVHQFETEAFHFTADEVERFREKSTIVRRDRLFCQLFQAFAGIVNNLLRTQPQLIDYEIFAGLPAGRRNNFLNADHLQNLDGRRTQSSSTAGDKHRMISSRSGFEPDGLIGREASY